MSIPRWAGARRRTLVGLRLAVVAALVGLVASAPAAQAVQPATPWSGSGPGTTSVDSDGTATLPEFSYSMNPAGQNTTRTWTFTTVADATGPVELTYDYDGFHAYAGVTAFLDATVTRGGSTTTTSLVAAGPQSCCTTPSNGFRYTGTVTLDIQAGDTYGFAFGGRNGDSTNVLQGTLTVGRAQTITFPQPDDMTVGQADATLAATASSGLDVTYATSTPTVCSVSGADVTPLAPGTCTIEADQEGDNLYWPAAQVVRSFEVAAAVATTVDVTLDPASIVADGSSTSTVTVAVQDQLGNPLAGETVVLASSDAGTAFGPVTDEGDGTYTATVTSTTNVGDVTITAIVGSANGEGTLTQTEIPATGTPTPSTPPTTSAPTTSAPTSSPEETPGVVEELADTGADGGVLAGVGLALVTAGALLLVLARRPRGGQYR